MGFKLRPVEATFYDLFAESGSHLVRGADLLAEILGVDSDRPALVKVMRETERQADLATHNIIRLVNSTFVTPFDREDIYRLAIQLDDVMDFIDDAASVIVLYQVDELPGEFIELVNVLQRGAQLTAEAMPRLRTMENLEDYWIEVNRLENQADRTYRRIVANLFAGSFDALDVLKLKGVVDAIEGAIDAMESVANTVEQISVKET